VTAGPVKVAIQPIYGWGWSDPTGSIDVPSSFTTEIVALDDTGPHRRDLGLAPRFAIGRVQHPAHEFSGLWVEVWARHVADDETYNVRFFNEQPGSQGALKEKSLEAVCTGFAEIRLV
jgi:hypothetical protein